MLKAEDARQTLDFERKVLSEILGIPGAMDTELLKVLQAADRIDGENYGRAVKQLTGIFEKARRNLLILAAAAPVAYYIAGGTFAAAFPFTGAKNTAAATSLVNGTPDHAFRASAGQRRTERAERRLRQEPQGRQLVLPFRREHGTAGSGNLYAGSLLAFLPSVVITGHVFGGGLVSGGINLGVAIPLTYKMAKSGIQGGQECYSKFVQARDLKAAGHAAQADATTADALKQCTQAGIDLTFATVATFSIGRQGLKDARQAIKDKAANIKSDPDRSVPREGTLARLRLSRPRPLTTISPKQRTPPRETRKRRNAPIAPRKASRSRKRTPRPGYPRRA